jgi:hypothetical protein
MQNGLFKISLTSFSQSVVNALAGGFIFALAAIASNGTIDVFAIDWLSVLRTAINAAVYTLVGSLTAAAGTTNDGKVLGRFKI